MASVDVDRRVDLSTFLDENELFISDGPVGHVTGRYKLDVNGNFEDVENGGTVYMLLWLYAPITYLTKKKGP